MKDFSNTARFLTLKLQKRKGLKLYFKQFAELFEIRLEKSEENFDVVFDIID
jgi:hypothetical protein